MFYTVIQRSGWQGSPWRIAKTFTDKNTAAIYARDAKQPNVREDFYSTRVMPHRKPINELTNYDNGTVKFSGNVVAWTNS